MRRCTHPLCGRFEIILCPAQPENISSQLNPDHRPSLLSGSGALSGEVGKFEVGRGQGSGIFECNGDVSPSDVDPRAEARHWYLGPQRETRSRNLRLIKNARAAFALELRLR